MWLLGILLVLTEFGVRAEEGVIYNEKTDIYVQQANILSKSKPTIQLEDMHPNLPIITIPFVGPIDVAVDGFVGEMGDRRTLKRLFDAYKFSSTCNETLTSVFQYEDLAIEYKWVLADFLYLFRLVSDLKLRVDANSFQFSITKTCTECKVNTLQVQAFHDYDIEVDILGSKFNPINWFMKWIVSYGFWHFNTYFIIDIINHQVGDLFQPFVETYCDRETPIPS